MRLFTNSPLEYDLAIIGTAGLPARYGGFETLAEQLVINLASRNRVVVGNSVVDSGSSSEEYKGAFLSSFKWKANGWQSIPYDIQSLFRLAPYSKTVLILGVSGCIALPIVRILWPSVRLVTNIDGIEWRRKKWGVLQKVFLRLSEWFAARFSHVVIADNEGIRLYLRKSLKIDSVLIAYGGDCYEDTYKSKEVSVLTKNWPDFYFSVCRIEPENNIDIILDAFFKLNIERVVIIGNWSASVYGCLLKKKYSNVENILLLDPIYDQNILWNIRQKAKAHIHGHSAGGTNPTLVEAMFAGMAALCFDVSYNRYTTNNKAFYWSNSEDLQKLITSLKPSELTSNAMHMKSIAFKEYTWEAVSSKYREILQLN